MICYDENFLIIQSRIYVNRKLIFEYMQNRIAAPTILRKKRVTKVSIGTIGVFLLGSKLVMLLNINSFAFSFSEEKKNVHNQRLSLFVFIGCESCWYFQEEK